MGRRVVITGIGVLSPVGAGKDALWAGCLADQSIEMPVPEAWHRYAPLRSRVWAPLPQAPELPDFISRIDAKQLDPVSQNALWAAYAAANDANLPPQLYDEKKRLFKLNGTDPERTGVFMGTGVGGIFTTSTSFAHQICSTQTDLLQSLQNGEPGQIPAVAEAARTLSERLVFPRRFNPFTVSMLMPNAPAADIAVKLGVQGPCRTYCMACASGTAAVGHGFRAVADREVDVALAGGSEYLFDEYGTVFRAFDELRTLAKKNESAPANRPFDTDRSGFLFSQGASAVIILESLDHARRRNATPIAEITGYAETCDAASIMMMDRDGIQIERMLTMLLAQGNTRADQVDYINAHGTGTELNDAVESDVISRMFRKDVAVNSTKALIGHTMGASGAVEAAVTALSLQHQALHGNPNLENPLAPLHFVRKAGPADLNTAISQSFAFGGHNTGLLFKRFTEDGQSPH